MVRGFGNPTSKLWRDCCLHCQGINEDILCDVAQVIRMTCNVCDQLRTLSKVRLRPGAPGSPIHEIENGVFDWASSYLARIPAYLGGRVSNVSSDIASVLIHVKRESVDSAEGRD